MSWLQRMVTDLVDLLTQQAGLAPGPALLSVLVLLVPGSVLLLLAIRDRALSTLLKTVLVASTCVLLWQVFARWRIAAPNPGVASWYAIPVSILLPQVLASAARLSVARRHAALVAVQTALLFLEILLCVSSSIVRGSTRANLEGPTTPDARSCKRERPQAGEPMVGAEDAGASSARGRPPSQIAPRTICLGTLTVVDRKKTPTEFDTAQAAA